LLRRRKPVVRAIYSYELNSDRFHAEASI